jgi:hypothetical protein
VTKFPWLNKIVFTNVWIKIVYYPLFEIISLLYKVLNRENIFEMLWKLLITSINKFFQIIIHLIIWVYSFKNLRFICTWSYLVFIIFRDKVESVVYFFDSLFVKLFYESFRFNWDNSFKSLKNDWRLSLVKTFNKFHSETKKHISSKWSAIYHFCFWPSMEIVINELFAYLFKLWLNLWPL